MERDVIIACDFPTKDELYNFLDLFKEEKPFIKIGMELFYGTGLEVVHEMKRRGHKVFLDLKLHDIPNTVKWAARNLARLEVDIISIHASGTVEMMQAAMKGINKAETDKKPIVVAITQLTSTSEERMRDDLLIDKTIDEAVIHYAKKAEEAGVTGVVSSPLEVPLIRENCSENFVTVTPGIRVNKNNAQDQVRITTPLEAHNLGSNYIVVGRSITQSEDPLKAYTEIKEAFVHGK